MGQGCTDELILVHKLFFPGLCQLSYCITDCIASHIWWSGEVSGDGTWLTRQHVQAPELGRLQFTSKENTASCSQSSTFILPTADRMTWRGACMMRRNLYTVLLHISVSQNCPNLGTTARHSRQLAQWPLLAAFQGWQYTGSTVV